MVKAQTAMDKYTIDGMRAAKRFLSDSEYRVYKARFEKIREEARKEDKRQVLRQKGRVDNFLWRLRNPEKYKAQIRKSREKDKERRIMFRLQNGLKSRRKNVTSEERKQQQKEYRQRNKEMINADRRKRYWKNVEHERARCRAYYLDNKVKENARCRVNYRKKKAENKNI